MHFLTLKTEMGWLAASWLEEKVSALVLPRKTETGAVKELKNNLGVSVIRGNYPQLAEGLQAYFQGKKDKFSLELVLDWATPFQRKVYEAAMRIPYGDVCSYGEIAVSIGNKGASRAVGGALGRNRIPLFIPCHRVVCGDGSLGGFSGGKGLKQKLLQLECQNV